MNPRVPLVVPTRPTRVRYFILSWICSLAMLTYIDRVCIKELRNDMQGALDLSDQQFAWVFSAFALSYSLFEVPSGWLGDRYGARQVLCRIVLWWSLFTALTGCVWNFSFELGYLPMPSFLADQVEPLPLVFNSLVLLILIRFLFGAGEAGAFPNASRALRDWFPYTRRGFTQGLLWTFGRWGGSLAPGMVACCAAWFSWRGAFLCFGIMGVCWVLCFASYFRNVPAEHPGVNAAERELIQTRGDEFVRPPISWRRLLGSSTLWWLSGMYFFSNAGWCFFITWDSKYYDVVLGLGETELFLATSAPLFFGGIACFLGGFCTDRQVRLWGPRWGRTLQGFLAYFLAGCFFLLALVAAAPFQSVLFLCLASFFKDFAMAVSWSTCNDVGHRYSGTVAGFMNMVGNLGTVVAPPVVARLAQYEQWDLALVFSAGMFFMACGCWLFINPRQVIVYREADHRRSQEQGILN